MKKWVIILIILAAAGITTFTIVHFVSGDSLESAIDDYEDGDYIDAIIELNRLARTTDYDTGEKIYYYRCRSINRLAEKLNIHFSEELALTALQKKGSREFDKARTEIDDELKDINSTIGGDLAHLPSMKKGNIITRGKFFNEFTARYRGSSYIEDLDYDELKKSAVTAPVKYRTAVVHFYHRYPRTHYLSEIVESLFNDLRMGRIKLAADEGALQEMIISYAKQFPSAPAANILFTCRGDNVNIRNSPGLRGKPTGKLKRDAVVIQMEKSMDTIQIGDTRDYWYRITSFSGQAGWIFGKFLAPLDLSRYSVREEAVLWAFEEDFTSWRDSHTPAEWSHIPGADPDTINFFAQGAAKIARLNAEKGKASGLYTRYNASKAFTILVKARYTGGDGLRLFAYVPAPGRSFSLILRDEKLIVSGRTIPLHTAQWHEYILSSDDGRFAKLKVDGEVISGRIKPAHSELQRRGIYALLSSTEEASQGEMEYLKAR